MRLPKRPLAARLPSAVAVAFALLATAPARAQTASEITQALLPKGPLGTTTRGIKPIAPTARPSATPASIDLDVAFATGSAELTPAAQTLLNRLGEAITGPALAPDTFKIVGHTDTVGNPSANLTLSQARAAAVKTYLEDKFGITDSRLESSGVGAADLAVPTPPNTPNAQNRRVQIINVSG